MNTIVTLAPTSSEVRRRLLAAASGVTTAALQTFAGVISLAPQRSGYYRMPIGGLRVDELLELVNAKFPGARDLLPALLTWHEQGSSATRQRLDEFADLLALLLAHQSTESKESRWLACAIATAAMADNHLWQDLGLPNRGVLNSMMQAHFTALKAKNAGDMKWKKFFYRQLCQQAEIPICKSPSCAQCSDYGLCFGGED